MRTIKIIFTRLLLAIITLFIINSLEPYTHFTLSLNLFNVFMISCFDIFGFILCVILKFIL